MECGHPGNLLRRGGHTDLCHGNAFFCVRSKRADAAAEKIMDDFLFIQSATVSEVSMLNCAMDTSSSVCVPNGPPLEFYLVSESSGVVLAGSENSPPDVFELKGKLLEFLRCTG